MPSSSCNPPLLKNKPYKNRYQSNSYTMGNLLYTIAVILIIIWAIGFLGGMVTSNLIHILLVIAIIVVLLRVIQGKKPLE